MKFTKIFSDTLDHCYAVMRLKNGNKDYVVVASEENQPCYAYDLNNQFARTTVWNDVGGTMTMVQIPGTLDFLATQKFYPGFNAAKCQIVKETFTNLGWKQTVLGKFPYIHRFDILEKGDGAGYWYVGCSIANSKRNSEDWSDPGKVWVGEYSEQFTKIKNLRALDFSLTKNHGYKRMGGYSLITGEQGIYKLIKPTVTADWKIKQLTDYETSDVYSTDIDGDDESEFLTIEGFHGPNIRLADHNFQTVIKSNGQTPFGHAIWGGNLGGQNYFIFGWREGEKNLVLIKNDQLDMQIIDRNVGPSNVTVYEKNGKQYLLSANRESNEVAIYEINV